MKKLLNNFPKLICLIIAGSFIFSSCSNSPDEETAKEKTLRLLSRTWQISSVKVDGSDKTNLFTGFKLTLLSGQYSTQNGDPLWPSSGTWSFINDSADIIRRVDGVEIQINSLTETKLLLSLDWDQTFGSGRLSSIGGNYVFELTN